MGSGESHFNVLLIVRAVTRQGTEKMKLFFFFNVQKQTNNHTKTKTGAGQRPPEFWGRKRKGKKSIRARTELEV